MGLRGRRKEEKIYMLGSGLRYKEKWSNIRRQRVIVGKGMVVVVFEEVIFESSFVLSEGVSYVKFGVLGRGNSILGFDVFEEQ